MPLKFHPNPGTILVADYGTGFKPPEMVKVRPVVVISPRLRRRENLCTVVPLSSTRPDPVEPFHHRLDPRSLPARYAETETWAKCDMLCTVGFDRLDRVRVGRNPDGSRRYVVHCVLPDDLLAIRRGVLAALGLKALIQYIGEAIL